MKRIEAVEISPEVFNLVEIATGRMLKLRLNRARTQDYLRCVNQWNDDQYAQWLGLLGREPIQK